jgi:CheY-like chemotaxis protein
MKKPGTDASAATEAGQHEHLLTQASQATWHDAKDVRQAAGHDAARIGMRTPHRQRPRIRYKRSSSSTSERLARTTDVLRRPRHPLGAVVRVRKRVQRPTPPRDTTLMRYLHALLYALLYAFRPKRHALRPHEGGRASTVQRSERHSRPDRRPPGRRHSGQVLPAPAAHVHATPWRGTSTLGGRRRGQPRGRPAPETPAHGTTASASTSVALPAVLVVDDEPTQRRLLHEILTLEGRLEGRAIYMAEHGGPALERLRASTEGMVVLFGLLMPQVNGEAVLEAVAADPALARRHAFVMVTAATPLATEGRVAKLRRLLDIPLIAKPFTVSAILQAVDDATRRLTSGPLPRD